MMFTTNYEAFTTNYLCLKILLALLFVNFQSYFKTHFFERNEIKNTKILHKESHHWIFLRITWNKFQQPVDLVQQLWMGCVFIKWYSSTRTRTLHIGNVLYFQQLSEYSKISPFRVLHTEHDTFRIFFTRNVNTRLFQKRLGISQIYCDSMNIRKIKKEFYCENKKKIRLAETLIMWKFWYSCCKFAN